MNYPDNFDTPTFPAGRSIAVSRWLAIAISVVFFLIICVAGVIFWGTRSASVDPFLISINQTTGLWSIARHEHLRDDGGHNHAVEMSAVQTIQESVVGNFAANWFTISAEAAENNAMWQSCEQATCASDEFIARTDNMCALSCAAAGDVFSQFLYNVVPDYTARVAAGEQWILDMDTLVITPSGIVSPNGGVWQISGQVISSTQGKIDVLAFATVGRQQDAYPDTLGYHITSFNAYRIN